MIYKRDSFQVGNNNVLFIGVLSGILFFCPVLGFILSLFCFRQKTALFLFVLFSFYFGWFYGPQLDLQNHYIHFKTLIGKTLIEAWNNPETIHSGKEPYPVLFKYIVGLVSANPRFFSACACVVYTALFVYGVLGTVRNLYVHKMPLPALVLFLGIIFTVEYNWFLGFRFWSGIFVFVSFYIRYIRTRGNRYLYFSMLCLCFHFSLLTLYVALVLNHILKKKLKLYYILIIVSFIVRFLQIPMTVIIAKLSVMEGVLKEASRNDEIIKSVAERMAHIRTQGNLFYLLRNEILLIGVGAIIILLWKRYGSVLKKKYGELWGMCLILFAFANFGYIDLIFYDRFLKVTLLMTYILVYIWVMDIKDDLNDKTQFWMLLFSVPSILYAIATIVVSQRQYLLNLELWFNNFLIPLLY